MPNHVANHISLQGDPEKIRSMLEAIQSDELGVGSVDFNKIIPMPKSLNIEAGSRTDRGLKAYCDPPYYNADQYYEAVSADGFDHKRLAETLLSIKGKFLLSYNDCPEIRELYARPGIVIEGTARLSNIAQRYDNGKMYPELLIANYDTTEFARSCVQLTLFDGDGTEFDPKRILNERILYNGTI